MNAVLEFADPNTLAQVVNVVCFAVGAWLGSWFPDIDRIAVLRLRHRSTVTHGCAAPALAIVAGHVAANEWAGWVAAGFAVGVGLHLAFDLFPGKWRGFALVDVPRLGRCTKTVSVAWLFANVFVCAGLAVWTVPALDTFSFVACVAVLGVLYFYGVFKKSEHFAAGPLLTLLSLGADAL
ncbi:MAG: hypothetical protein OXF55_05175 [Caldilineaceae bacterium]|nr:hypothetical protein [Caldilineaceae bacterium]